jgi:hypothetical protein
MSVLDDTRQRQKFDSVRGFLESLGLQEYTEFFEKEAIDLELLKSGTITDMDLKEIGVSKLGHRKKIINSADLIA